MPVRWTRKAIPALLCAAAMALQGCAQWFALPTVDPAYLSTGRAATAFVEPSPTMSASPAPSAPPAPTATLFTVPTTSPTPSPALSPTLTPTLNSSPSQALRTAAGISPSPPPKPSPSATPKATAAPASDAYRVRCDGTLAVRESPAPSAKILRRLNDGDRVRVTGYEGAFARIVDADGDAGYAVCGYLVPEAQDKWLTTLDVVKPAQSYSYGRMMLDLKSLAAKYPGKLILTSAGRSVQGRDIPVAILGDLNAKRQVLVQGSIHAREYMTTLLIMAQIEYSLKYPGEAGNALDGVCLHILPMTNPDGVAISQTAAMTDALNAIYAQDKRHDYTDLPPQDYLRTWKANAAGVDLNRNFPAGWQSIKSAGGPSSWLYKGAHAADQPETKALMNYTKRYAFNATVSYHATGGSIYWQCGDDKTVNSLSKSLANAVRSRTGYELLKNNGQDSGGYKDWVMGSLGIPSVTVEIGSRECPLPLDDFYTVWVRNREVLDQVAEWVKGN